MNSKMSIAAAVCAVTFGFTAAAQAEWKPTKPVEFVVTSGAGGGTDTFARTIQSIIAKNKLMDAPGRRRQQGRRVRRRGLCLRGGQCRQPL